MLTSCLIPFGLSAVILSSASSVLRYVLAASSVLSDTSALLAAADPFASSGYFLQEPSRCNCLSLSKARKHPDMPMPAS